MAKTKLSSAADLIDHPVVCPVCGAQAFLRHDDQGFSIECQGQHEPVLGIREETSLQVLEEEQAGP